MLNPATLKAQAQKWTEHEAKKAKMMEEYNHQISFRADKLPIIKISYVVNSRKEVTMKITRGDNPLNLIVYSNFRLKQLGFSEWLEVHALASKKSGTSNNLLLQSLRTEYSGRQVDEMDRNLIPPPGIMPIQGLVIKEPESGIFFMNGNTGIGFQKESEFHLAPTTELIRLQRQIKIDTKIAREMFSKMNYVIEARNDCIKAREMVMKGISECKASECNVKRIQVKGIVKVVEDYMNTYSSAEMDISCYVEGDVEEEVEDDDEDEDDDEEEYDEYDEEDDEKTSKSRNSKELGLSCMLNIRGGACRKVFSYGKPGTSSWPLKYYAGAADKIHGKTLRMANQLQGHTLHEPIGVVGHIIPWNFPIGMFFFKTSPALAVGCPMVAGIPDGVINVVTEFRPTAGAAISSHMDIDCVDKVQYDKVLSYIEHGKRQGATLLTGGKPCGEKGFYIEPTIFADVTDDMLITTDEIFGPVISVFKFKKIEEATTRASATRYGLAAGIATKDLNIANTVSRSIRAGIVWINCYLAFDPGCPYGGYKMSGFGREFGMEGLYKYLQVKAVVTPLHNSPWL
ncbi:aldehyde dehydrogenase family 2 member C4-like protein [Tanacetum coccineum]